MKGSKAFPKANDREIRQDGMDLRDYFAAKYIQGVVSSSEMVQASIKMAQEDEVSVEKVICRQAYKMADVALEIREEN